MPSKGKPRTQETDVDSEPDSRRGAEGPTSNVSQVHDDVRNPSAASGVTSSNMNLQTVDFVAAVQAAVQAAMREVVNSADATERTTQGDPVTRHLAAESGRLVPAFNPTTSTSLTAEEWIRKVDDLAGAYDWNDKRKCCYALLKLQGVAKTWYDGVPSPFNTWDEWKEELCKAFPDTASAQRRFREMESRRKMKNESLEEYYYDKLTKARRCKLDDRPCVEYIITGLGEEDSIRALGASTFNRPEDLLCALKRIEERLIGMKSTAGQKQANLPTKKREDVTGSDEASQTQAFDTKKGPRCYNCNGFGHISSKCPQPSKKQRCGNCNKPGHLTKECPEKASVAKGKDVAQHIMETGSETSNAKYFMEAKVNGNSVRSYLDLGSQCVTLRESDASRMQLKYEKLNKPYTINGYGSGQIVPLGETRVSLEVDQATAEVDVYIVSDDAQRIPLLIGHPFTEQNHITIVRRRNVVRVFEEPLTENLDADEESLMNMKIPDLPQRRVNLWSAEATVIPSGYVGFVQLQAPSDLAAGDVFIEAQFRPQANSESCIPRCVISIDDTHSSCVPVMNLSARDLHIRQNEVVVRGDSCTETREPVEELKSNLCCERSLVDFSQVNIGPCVPPKQRDNLLTLLEKYRNCFAVEVSEIGCTDAVEMKLELTTDIPVTFRPYRLSSSEREVVRELVEELRSAGIVVDSTSPYASPILLVRKRTGDYRLCVDYRALNRITKPDRYPLPLIDDQLERLKGQCYFTSLDLASGYYQIKMTSESQPKTAFVTPDGYYEFVRMPFGLSNAPAVFQRMVNSVLGPLRYSIALAYMDDILIPSTSVEEGLQHLEEVLKVLQSSGLTLRLGKCSFLQDQVDYLGYEVSASGIRPGRRKLESILDFPRPNDVHRVRQFLGLTSYFRRFVKGFATVAAPLTKLTAKNVPWEWTDEQETAFRALKLAITERPVLAHYAQDAETEVHTDASQDGLGAVLMQKQTDERFHPVAFASRRTTTEERKYHSHELETLAIVWALEKFRVYVLGIKFTVVTDCNAVRCTMTKRSLLPRIGRWWLRLQEFKFDTEHRPGSSLAHADALSRSPTGDPETLEPVNGMILATMITEDDWLVAAQATDSRIRIRDLKTQTLRDRIRP
ncbi:uncharacterized protein LOC135392282 [Ornithodoros turicata]|uniref:uncharacterized protein LOC135392282 n=1 Tax=Ornithodoros turicata TaxID=34597 RepID=UPI0031388F10